MAARKIMVKPPRQKILAAMPAYNEESYIGSIVLKTKKYVDDVLVIDDGSTDQTSAIAKLAGAVVIRYPKRNGKGQAIQKIISKAKEKDIDILVLLDADSQHNPDEITNLVKAVSDGYDLVIGSRNGESYKTPKYRRIGQKILLYFTQFLSKEKIIDSESGFRALSRKAIHGITLYEDGFAVDTEMIACASDSHLVIGHVPISNIYVIDGSTLNPVRHGLGVLLRILAMISERRPVFFFGLSGSIVMVLGIIFGFRVLWINSVGGIVSIVAVMVPTVLILVGTLSVFTGIILYAIKRAPTER